MLLPLIVGVLLLYTYRLNLFGVDTPVRVIAVSALVALEETIGTPMRDKPRVSLEETDGDEVVVRIGVSHESTSDGPRLASEVLTALAGATRRAQAA